MESKIKPEGFGITDKSVLDNEIKKQQDRILAAAGKIPVDLVLHNAGIINVFTGEIEYGDIAVFDGIIVGIGDYASLADNEKIVDCTGRFISPGFIDGHIHIESSMLSPAEFAAAVVPHGTTAVITDPHEIVNVAGLAGLDYMLKASDQLPLEVFLMLPSCVPATSLDESGANLYAVDLAEYMKHDRILGLAELMDFYRTAEAREDIIDKILLTKQHKKQIDGHAPGLKTYSLNAYTTAGVASDHECSNIEEALEKLRRGQWIMIREGTAARNMEALMPLFEPAYAGRCMLVTDDKHPGDLLRQGHVDYLIRKAVEYGADPITAIRMATINAAQYFGLTGMGAAAPGYKADLVILKDLKSLTVEAVYKNGKLTADRGEYKEDNRRKEKNCLSPQDISKDINSTTKYPDNIHKIYTSFHLKELVPEDFTNTDNGNFMRVIELVPRELLTKELILPYPMKGFHADEEGIYEDIIKLAVAERHHNTGHIGLGYLKGYGLKAGAIASSVAHDSHNLIIAGTNNEDMCLAANQVRRNQGGLVIVENGRIAGELALPIAGLMCEDSADKVDAVLAALKQEARKLGVKEGIDPFMTLAFLSLPVIPEVRLTTKGIADVKTQKIVKTRF
jgi:adenine deaminase